MTAIQALCSAELGERLHRPGACSHLSSLLLMAGVQVGGQHISTNLAFCLQSLLGKQKQVDNEPPQADMDHQKELPEWAWFPEAAHKATWFPFACAAR